MKIHQGDLIASEDMDIDFEEITGTVIVKEGVKIKAKNLKTVGGYLYIYSQATLPKLETVGGDLSSYSQATLEAPKLTNKNDATARPRCEKALALSFKKKGLIQIDGILSWLISRKKTVNEEALKRAGYDVLVFLASEYEDLSRITCGNAILSGSLPLSPYEEVQL